MSPKVFTQDIDSIWQNVTVNKCQAVKNIYFLPKTGGASIRINTVLVFVHEILGHYDLYF